MKVPLGKGISIAELPAPFTALMIVGVSSKRIVLLPPLLFGAFPDIVSVVVPDPEEIVVTQLSFVALPVQFASDTYQGTAEELAAMSVAPKSSNSSIPSTKIEFLGFIGSNAIPR